MIHVSAFGLAGIFNLIDNWSLDTDPLISDKLNEQIASYKKKKESGSQESLFYILNSGRASLAFANITESLRFDSIVIWNKSPSKSTIPAFS